MRNIYKGTVAITAESDRGQSIIINEWGQISFECNGNYVETNIDELTELVEMATKFRDRETRKNG